LEGDSVTAQLMLRDFVKGTIGFEELGRRLSKSPKSLMRMLSAKGNPRADNLSAILKALQAHEGVTLTVTAG
ncbi:MAG: DNA-binding protein, partial [Rhodothalassiaceae bacterium]